MASAGERRCVPGRERARAASEGSVARERAPHCGSGYSPCSSAAGHASEAAPASSVDRSAVRASEATSTDSAAANEAAPTISSGGTRLRGSTRQLRRAPMVAHERARLACCRNRYFLPNAEIVISMRIGSSVDVVSLLRNGFFFFHLSSLIKLSCQYFV